jgi:hypothetical protein
MKRSLVGRAKTWGMGIDTVKLRGILADLIRARIALGARRSRIVLRSGLVRFWR